MNSSSGKKKKQCLVRANPKRHGPYVSVETSPTIDDILWSVGNNLAASHRDLSLAGVDNCTLLKPPSMKSVFECVWVCACMQVCILCEDWLWSRGYHAAELEAICCLLQSCWTTVSYVNWPFVQCAKWNQHIREMRGARSPLGPRTDGQNVSLLLTE